MAEAEASRSEISQEYSQNVYSEECEDEKGELVSKPENEINEESADKVDSNKSKVIEETDKNEKAEIPVDLNSSPPSPLADGNTVEGACGSSDIDQNGGNKAADDGESIHQIKWVYFKKKHVPIITQNENGPCPLLALINVLLLQNRVKLTPQAEIVSASQLMAHLGDCVLQNVPGEDVSSYFDTFL